jgi:hypothetical protein
MESKMRMTPAMINTTAEKTNHPVRFKTVAFPSMRPPRGIDQTARQIVNAYKGNKAPQDESTTTPEHPLLSIVRGTTCNRLEPPDSLRKGPGWRPDILGE